MFNAIDIVVVENLTKLEQCGNDLFLFCALPLKYRESDGAPVRAIGILDVI
jgi:kynurenine formamidase